MTILDFSPIVHFVLAKCSHFVWNVKFQLNPPITVRVLSKISSLTMAYDGCCQRDVKTVSGDLNTQVGREAMYRPVIGPNSLTAVSNNNG